MAREATISSAVHPDVIQDTNFVLAYGGAGIAEHECTVAKKRLGVFPCTTCLLKVPPTNITSLNGTTSFQLPSAPI